MFAEHTWGLLCFNGKQAWECFANVCRAHLGGALFQWKACLGVLCKCLYRTPGGCSASMESMPGSALQLFVKHTWGVLCFMEKMFAKHTWGLLCFNGKHAWECSANVSRAHLGGALFQWKACLGVLCKCLYRTPGGVLCFMESMPGSALQLFVEHTWGVLCFNGKNVCTEHLGAALLQWKASLGVLCKCL